MKNKVLITCLGILVFSSCTGDQIKKIQSDVVMLEKDAVKNVEEDLDKMVELSEDIPAHPPESQASLAVK